MASSRPSTPLMRQYHAVKQQAPDALLMFRLGDFYEFFYDDAVVAAKDLGITLTSRNKEKGEPIPMCGVPAHSADGYIAKLIAKGRRVAICDQVGEADKATKLVRRELTRILTPGTAADFGLLVEGENNYLAAVAEHSDRTGLAYADISTGEFRMTEIEPGEIDAELDHLRAREVLHASAGPLFAEPEPAAGAPGNRLRTELEGWIFDVDYAQRLLRDHFRLLSLDGLGGAGHEAAIAAAGALVHYLRDTQKAALEHIEPPVYYAQRDCMVLDTITVRNLELVEPLFGGERESTLLRAIDTTRTSMGKRLLRQRLLRPSLSPVEIESRLDALDELRRRTITRTEVERVLSGIADIERLLAKVTLGTANPRDLVALGSSLACLPTLRELISEFTAPRLKSLLQRMDELADVRERILGVIADEPPIKISDGGVIRAGVDAELDDLREVRQNSRGYIASMEARERERTGVQSLKVRFNNVFGFYIEVSKANLAHVPDNYERKQTLVNAERYVTAELKEYEAKVLSAEDRILVKEKALFEQVRAFVTGEAQRIRGVAAAVAELDVHAGLARVAAEQNFCRPSPGGDEIQIAAGRHPIVERLAQTEGGGRFIANDVYLNDSDHLLALITGPNMGGKSTYLRQTALIVILAQMGSFVPATSARTPIVDRIFTRIGASDNLAMGRSTFMVEMTETAEILNTATSRSLILLDEVGRGTSTFDGLAIAWAVVEYIHSRTRAKTLFATHYHELTELAELMTGVSNLHVSVKESGENIVFLHKVEPGKADRSYGLEVARLAGLPQAVIERGRSVLARHEETEQSLSEELSTERPLPLGQDSIFSHSDNQVLEELSALNLDELRPIEALNLLQEWKRRLADRLEGES